MKYAILNHGKRCDCGYNNQYKDKLVVVWINILALNIYQAIKSSVTHYEDNID
jgi:hypothetical protein